MANLIKTESDYEQDYIKIGKSIYDAFQDDDVCRCIMEGSQDCDFCLMAEACTMIIRLVDKKRGKK